MPVTLPELTKDSTLSDVRTALGDAARTAIELKATPADKRAETYEADARAVVDFINFADPIEKALAAEGRGKQPEGESRGGRSLGADLDDEVRSIGRQVTEAPGYDEWRQNQRGPFVIEARNLIGGFTAGVYDSGADSVLPVGSPVVVPGSMQRRRAFVRDIMSVQSTGLRVVPYWRELDQVTNETGAQMTSEGSAKAEVTMEFEAYNAVIEKITAWLPATEEIFADAPTLQGYINTRLEYMLMVREEDQVLNGTGTSPEIEGLTTVQGTQTQAQVTSSNGDYPATIGLAISKVENVDGEADAVVTNPLDYWVAVTKRHQNQFDHGFGGGAPDMVGGITWGLRAVRTRAVTSGTAWVGSWRIGSTLFDRQQTTIKVGDQHSDYFIRNLLVIRAEKRIGVAWHRPALFVEATVPTS